MSGLEKLLTAHRNGSLTRIEKGLEESSFSSKQKEFKKTWTKLSSYKTSLYGIITAVRITSPELYTAQTNLLADRVIQAHSYCQKIQQSYETRIKDELQALENRDRDDASQKKLVELLRLASITGNRQLRQKAQNIQEKYSMQISNQLQETDYYHGEWPEPTRTQLPDDIDVSTKLKSDKNMKKKLLRRAISFVTFASIWYYGVSCQ